MGSSKLLVTNPLRQTQRRRQRGGTSKRTNENERKRERTGSFTIVCVFCRVSFVKFSPTIFFCLSRKFHSITNNGSYSRKRHLLTRRTRDPETYHRYFFLWLVLGVTYHIVKVRRFVEISLMRKSINYPSRLTVSHGMCSLREVHGKSVGIYYLMKYIRIIKETITDFKMVNNK